MSLQQSPEYIEYVKHLGWSSVMVDGVTMIFKRIIFIGTLAKIQRPTHLPETQKLIKALKENNIQSIAIEPEYSVDQKTFSEWLPAVKSHVRVLSTYYLPTKTIAVDLQGQEQDIFRQLTEAKQRAIRRALKHNIYVKESRSISDLISIKNKSAGLFGFITTHGITHLWNVLPQEQTAILLAYSSTNELIGGVLLVLHKRIAYYWIAGATKKGKKLFAPTLLVWEAFKLAKKRGCTLFDFVGVWDERMPKQYTTWKGFTKFKEGFGGKELYYPIHD